MREKEVNFPVISIAQEIEGIMTDANRKKTYNKGLKDAAHDTNATKLQKKANKHYVWI